MEDAGDGGAQAQQGGPTAGAARGDVAGGVRGGELRLVVGEEVLEVGVVVGERGAEGGVGLARGGGQLVAGPLGVGGVGGEEVEQVAQQHVEAGAGLLEAGQPPRARRRGRGVEEGHVQRHVAVNEGGGVVVEAAEDVEDGAVEGGAVEDAGARAAAVVRGQRRGPPQPAVVDAQPAAEVAQRGVVVALHALDAREQQAAHERGARRVERGHVVGAGAGRAAAAEPGHMRRGGRRRRARPPARHEVLEPRDGPVVLLQRELAHGDLVAQARLGVERGAGGRGGRALVARQRGGRRRRRLRRGGAPEAQLGRLVLGGEGAQGEAHGGLALGHLRDGVGPPAPLEVGGDVGDGALERELEGAQLRRVPLRVRAHGRGRRRGRSGHDGARDDDGSRAAGGGRGLGTARARARGRRVGRLLDLLHAPGAVGLRVVRVAETLAAALHAAAAAGPLLVALDMAEVADEATGAHLAATACGLHRRRCPSRAAGQTRPARSPGAIVGERTCDGRGGEPGRVVHVFVREGGARP